MIKPTIGRVVWFHPASNFIGAHFDKAEPLAAIIVHVWTDRMVNLAVFDQNGCHHCGATSVRLLQDGDETLEGGHYCQWMPYQIGQAKKNAVE
jgi:hypothetical protein